MKAWPTGGALLGLVLLGCASLPRPQVVTEADRVAHTPAAEEARVLAPQAHAHALQLGERAEAAYDAGDLAGAQILGEHAIAAMNRAFVLARMVKAQKRLDEANAKLAKNQQKLAGLDEQAQRITAEADNLELRVKVLRDAQPLATPTAAASPERERARAAAARALLSQARLLCLSTRLLEPKRPGVNEQLAKVDALEASVAKDTTVDLNAATEARSACLKELTLVRRPSLLEAPAEGLTDTLLEALTKTEKFYAFRDDRGVVVVLRDVWTADGKPTAAGAEQLEALARVAKANPKFPLLVVSHSASNSNDRRELDAIVAFLVSKGAPSVQGHAAGDAQPVAPPKRAGARERNARVEIVFVAPSS